MKKKIAIIFAYLKKLFPNPETELNYSTPFQLLVAVMLSAQSTDIQVNKVTGRLFEEVKIPEDIINMKFEKFERAISSVNYYHTKAKHIFATAKLLKQWKTIPSDLDTLLTLPGVGIKTAKVIVHVLYDKPFIAVDTHVHRVANRLGLVDTTSPEKTSELLEKVIPDSYKNHAHHSFVLFGRYYCIARNPKCESCALQKICLFYKKNHV